MGGYARRTIIPLHPSDGISCEGIERGANDTGSRANLLARRIRSLPRFRALSFPRALRGKVGLVEAEIRGTITLAFVDLSLNTDEPSKARESSRDSLATSARASFASDRSR